MPPFPLTQVEPSATELDEASVSPGQLVHRLGHTFAWSSLHQKPSQLAPLRQLGDESADAVCVAVASLGKAGHKALDAAFQFCPFARESEVGTGSPLVWRVFGFGGTKPRFLQRGFTAFRRVMVIAWLHTSAVQGAGLCSSLSASTLHKDGTVNLEVQSSGQSLTCALPAAVGRVCAEFLEEVSAVPDWVDAATVSRAQAFFRSRAVGCNLALLHLSLVGGFGAPLVNRVLSSTGYLIGHSAAPQRHSENIISKRLFETSSMVHACMLEGGLSPGSPGWEHTVAVRLLHASVRIGLCSQTRRAARARAGLPAEVQSSSDQSHRPVPPTCPLSSGQSVARSEWDKEEWGVPINQEDLMITQLVFSFVVVAALELMQLWDAHEVLPLHSDHAHVALSQSEEADFEVLLSNMPDDIRRRHSRATYLRRFEQYSAYMHLWRYIGHLMGVKESSHMMSLASAKAMTESVVLHLVQPDGVSALLADSVLTGMADTFPAFIPRPFLVGMTWRLQGEALARKLRIPWVPGMRTSLQASHGGAVSSAGHSIFDSSLCGYLLWAAVESRMLFIRSMTLMSDLPWFGPLFQGLQIAGIMTFLDLSLDDGGKHDYSLKAKPSMALQHKVWRLGEAKQAAALAPCQEQSLATVAYYASMFAPMHLRRLVYAPSKGLIGLLCIAVLLLALLLVP